MPHQHILDNRTRTVADYLRKHLRGSDAFRLVSAYFSIYGYKELADALESVSEVRFLYGDPTSIDDVDPGQAEPRSFDVTEKGLNPRHVLDQRFAAQRCAEWVGCDTVRIRSIAQTNFLHGKLYLTSPPVRSIVGSSNFTQRGLGASSQPNIEINFASDDLETYAELREWFDRIWADDRLTIDVKQQVLDALARVGREHDPELIYYKTLYELLPCRHRGPPRARGPRRRRESWRNRHLEYALPVPEGRRVKRDYKIAASQRLHTRRQCRARQRPTPRWL